MYPCIVGNMTLVPRIICIQRSPFMWRAILSHSFVSLENLESPGVIIKPASRAALAV
ncbi:hypothetical protein DsansV1_C11g0108861 [Dioscorea sansibarensis]